MPRDYRFNNGTPKNQLIGHHDASKVEKFTKGGHCVFFFFFLLVT
jgi:hypothetical protein